MIPLFKHCAELFCLLCSLGERRIRFFGGGGKGSDCTEVLRTASDTELLTSAGHYGSDVAPFDDVFRYVQCACPADGVDFVRADGHCVDSEQLRCGFHLHVALHAVTVDVRVGEILLHESGG